MQPPDAPALETLPAPTSRIAGFWRRVGALVLDSLVLALLGIPLGFLLGERFAPVGTPARLMGLLVLIPYLGLLGSQVGRGQTLGKRLLGLRVVDASGQPLSVTRACMRAALLSLPWALNGLHFRTLGPLVRAVLSVSGILVFGLGGAIIGTYLLNRRTRQAMHDLLVGSYVIESAGVGLAVPGLSTRRPLVAGLSWIGLAAAASMAMAFMSPPKQFAEQFPPAVLERISAIPGVSSAEIQNLTTRSAGRSEQVVVAVLLFNGPEEDTRHAASEAAAVMLQQHPAAATAQRLVVTVVRGWDIGIARTVSTTHFQHTPAEWRAELDSE